MTSATGGCSYVFIPPPGDLGLTSRTPNWLLPCRARRPVRLRGWDRADRGSEYTAGAFRAACQRLSVCQSMGRPGSALDNAVIESWHSTLEFELRSVEHFATKAAARARVPAWIHDYNHNRRHSACQMMSPVDYERALAAGEAA
jgi:transposase InsO family protein